MFIDEARKYILSGQTAFYVNTREESRVIAAIREVGWRLAPPEIVLDSLPREFLSSLDYLHFSRFLSDLQAVLTLTGLPACGETVSIETLIGAVAAIDTKVVAADEAEAVVKADKLLRSILNYVGFPTISWDAVSGFSETHLDQDSFIAAMDRVSSKDLPARCLIVMKDCHGHLSSDDTRYRRALRNVCEDNRLVSGDFSRHLFFVQPHWQVHADVQHCLIKLDFPLPRDENIEAEIDRARTGATDPTKCDCGPELRGELVSALRGLDSANIATALAYCIVEFGGFLAEKKTDGKTKRLIPTVRHMRSRQLSAGNGMRIVDPDDPELRMNGSLAGFENLEELAEWIKFCRTPKAKELKLQAPSGFAVIGAPGCLAGDTVVQYLQNGHRGGRAIKLAELYKKFNGITTSSRTSSRPWGDWLASPTYLHSLNPDGTVFYNQIAAVIDSGKKKTVRVGFSDGSSLCLTDDHPIAVPGVDFVEAGALRIGSAVLAKDLKEVTVVSLADAGELPTYDIKMTAPAHNFCANGIFVHNCGKSVSCKLFSYWTGLPLVVVNMATLKEGLVGASERNTAMAIETIRALGQCNVLFDEFDKQAGGITGSNTDGNTSSGMLSLILDFASDPRRTATLMFTMNRMIGPIEALRAGRISRFYHVPPPDAVDREEILMLKLAEAEAKIPNNLSKIACDEMTGGFAGAELTELVRTAIILSAQRCGKKEPTLDELEQAKKMVTPVSRLNKEEVDAMNSFNNIAVSVSKKKTKAQPAMQVVSNVGRRRINIAPGDELNN